ncbi:hypothetical protein ACFL1U_01505 [Patescibacteria group bacterium]
MKFTSFGIMQLPDGSYLHAPGFTKKIVQKLPMPAAAIKGTFTGEWGKSDDLQVEKGMRILGVNRLGRELGLDLERKTGTF